MRVNNFEISTHLARLAVLHCNNNKIGSSRFPKQERLFRYLLNKSESKTTDGK